MDNVDFFALLLALAFTALCYGAVPLLYCLFHKGSVSKRQFRTLCIISGICGYLLFFGLSYTSGDSSSAAPAVLWTVLWYKVCCGMLSARGRLDTLESSSESAASEPEKPVTDVGDVPCEVVEEYHSDYVYPSAHSISESAAIPLQQPMPEEPSVSSKAFRRIPLWSWIVICALTISCCGLIYTTVSAHQRLGELEEALELKSGTISVLRKQNDSLNATADQYHAKAEYFDLLQDALSSGNLGYASSNFRASKSVFFLSADSDPVSFTLTAHWSGGGTVDMDQPFESAFVEFDNDSWSTSTSMTITPFESGVDIVTFSNDIDSRTFSIVIVVTD